jgi:hypothetical protein
MVITLGPSLMGHLRGTRNKSFRRLLAGLWRPRTWFGSRPVQMGFVWIQRSNWTGFSGSTSVSPPMSYSTSIASPSIDLTPTLLKTYHLTVSLNDARRKRYFAVWWTPTEVLEIIDSPILYRWYSTKKQIFTLKIKQYNVIIGIL